MGRRRGRRRPHVGDEDEDGPRPLTAQGRAAVERLAKLEADPRVRAAALVAYTFHLDPAVVIGEEDQLKASVRIAAHNVVQSEERKRQPKAKGTGGRQS